MQKKIFFGVLLLAFLFSACTIKTQQVVPSANVTTTVTTTQASSGKTCGLNYEIGKVTYTLINDTNQSWSCIVALNIPVKNNLQDNLTLSLGLSLNRYLEQDYTIPEYYWEHHFYVGGSNPDSQLMSPRTFIVEPNSAKTMELTNIYDYCDLNETAQTANMKLDFNVVYGTDNPKQELICS